ncbi:MAG TPA: hypothetical protein VHP83_09820 [Aggregatilineaceae bacterium]|nr:hypothetical protein [Aggregatilineaceae bacterium]
MVDILRRLWLSENPPAAPPPEPLSAERIDAGYRLFWTKMALGWDSARRDDIARQLVDVFQSPAFERNALERRFAVDGLDDQAHSGASLVALAEVLQALDNFESNEENGR